MSQKVCNIVCMAEGEEAFLKELRRVLKRMQSIGVVARTSKGEITKAGRKLALFYYVRT